MARTARHLSPHPEPLISTALVFCFLIIRCESNTAVVETKPRATKAHGSAITLENVKSFSTGWRIKEQLEHNVHLTFVYGDVSMRKVQNGAPSGREKPSYSPHHARFHKPSACEGTQGEGTDILLLDH